MFFRSLTTSAALLLAEPPRAIILAMVISYSLCFAGLGLAWWSYRRRQKTGGAQERGEKRE